MHADVEKTLVVRIIFLILEIVFEKKREIALSDEFINLKKLVSLPSASLGRHQSPDFGRILYEPSFPRQISAENDDLYERERERFLEHIDYHMRGQNSIVRPADEPYNGKDPCRENRNEWDIHPNCLFVHEEISLHSARFLGHGEFREAWLVKRHGSRDLVVKTYIDEPDGTGVDPEGLRDVAVSQDSN